MKEKRNAMEFYKYEFVKVPLLIIMMNSNSAMIESDIPKNIDLGSHQFEIIGMNLYFNYHFILKLFYQYTFYSIDNLHYKDANSFKNKNQVQWLIT